MDKQQIRAQIAKDFVCTPITKTKYVACDERLWLPKDPQEFIEYMQEFISKLPADAKDAEIEFDCNDDYGTDYITASLKYTSIETPEEVSARAEKLIDSAWAAQLQELETLKRLKEKYETN